MSGEQLTNKHLKKENLNISFSSSKPTRVNINHLLHKIREEKNKEKKENYVFVGLVVGVIAVTGIIASL